MKNLSKRFPLLLLLALLLLTSCGKVTGEGKIESKDLKVEDFVNLNLKGDFRVFYVNSDSSFVNVETYPNIADNLKIKVSENTLSISEKRPTQNVDFYNITVYSKLHPQRVSVEGFAELNVSGQIQTDTFTLNLKKNAKFIGSVKSRLAKVTMSEKSRANFDGHTQKANLVISDSASIISPFWQLNVLDISSKRDNYAEMNVRDSLKGSIENTAKLVYYGDPVRALKIAKSATVENRKLD